MEKVIKSNQTINNMGLVELIEEIGFAKELNKRLEEVIFMFKEEQYIKASIAIDNYIITLEEEYATRSFKHKNELMTYIINERMYAIEQRIKQLGWA